MSFLDAFIMVFVGLVTSGITSAGRGVQTLFKLHSYYMELIMDHECCYEGHFFQYCFSKVKKARKDCEQMTGLMKT